MHEANGVRMAMEFGQVTPSMAEKMLREYDYDRQRNLRPTNIDYLVKQMQRGDFRPWSVLQLTHRGEEKILTDGRHRLTAVVLTGLAQHFWVLHIYEAAPEDVYVTTDVGAARTLQNTTHALGTFDSSELSLLSGPSALAAARLLAQPKISLRLAKHTAVELDRYFHEWYPSIVQYENAIRGGTLAQRMRSSIFIVAGAVTLRHEPTKAHDFWRGIAYDDGLARADPRKRVADALRDPESILRVGVAGMGGLRILRFLAYYWNKYRIGAEVRRAPGDYPDPFMFDGTGWSSSESDSA